MSTAAAPAALVAAGGVRQVVADYVTLTKPKVQSLLLLTTITTMYVAGDPSLALVFWTVLGGSLASGGAGAINHYYDRDIDAAMPRTASRPVPAGRISPRAALTFGIALIVQGLFQNYFGSSGLPYAIPPSLSGGKNLGFMFLPNYRAWVIVFSLIICFATWFVIEKTRIGAYLRAATENPTIVRAFGINVPRMVTLTYGFGVALAALAGVMAAPIYNVSPQMGSDLIIVVFAVVVIGGMGSILGAILTGFALGIIEGLTKVFYPEASNTVIFVIMAIVLILRPAGLFGKEA